MAVLIYTENWDGQFKKLTFELASYGVSLAEQLQVPAIALSVGNVPDDSLIELGKYGVQKVLKVEDDQFKTLDNRSYTKLIAEVADSVGASTILMAHNNVGKGLAPRVAVRLQAGLGSGVTGLPKQTSPFVVSKKVFSGKAFADLEIKADKRVLTLAQNAFELIENPVDPSIEIFTPVDGYETLTKVKDVQKQSGKIILTDADIVVSGGRGMKSGDNWGPIEELAGILGAATACSRPVSDEGWRPHEEHTGQTGKIIAPNLYFAFGISGAIQHLAGVSSSKCLVAVNTDPDAPIFEAADYGIVGDAQQVLPELIKAVKEIKG